MGNVAVDSTAVNGTVTAQSKRADNARVYSEDKNIWEGMTVKEAYKKGGDALTIFNKADIDGDGVISKKELQRYDGPIYTLEKEEDGDSIVANFNGTTTGVGVAVGGNGAGVVASGGTTEGAVSGKLKKTIKQEFYPGLDVSEVKSWARDKYQEFDVAPRDGVLSKKEMKLYEFNEKIKKQEEKIGKLKDKKPSGFELGSGIFGGISCLMGIAHLADAKEFNPYDPGMFKPETLKTLGKTAVVVGLGALAIGGLSYIFNKHQAKQELNKEEQILNNLKKERATMMKS